MRPHRSASAQAFRVLLVAYPRSLRRALGTEMVQLVDDRRTLDHEPLWRLWPSLLLDTARAAVVTRWEDLMSTKRSILLGGLGAVVVLAALSDGPRAAFPLILVLLLAMAIVWRSHQPVVTPDASRSWRRWLVTGGVLLGGALGYVALDGDEELTELEWLFSFGGLMVGVFALLTGVVLLASARARSVATR
jgi:hypothetical protein